ncbi:hypothetical protein [Actinoplanes sp. M2I2]|uniref:hypothetical protein n=1 Tax=Actinoplanes sp. M2I2 TaxID=1734444 RepID=UPI002021CEC0|nr:hypothetical protein [Actinoplanes sp. M2I2]
MSPIPELDAKALARHCAAALAAHPTPGRFAALVVGPTDPTADVVRTVEASSTAEHDLNSIYLLVLDRQTGQPAGAGRVVRGGGRTLDDAPERIGRDLSAIVEAHSLHDGGLIWDLATLSVLPAYRTDRSAVTVSALLHRSLLRAGHRAGVRHLVALLDSGAHRDLTLLGLPFVPMAGAEPVDGVHAVYAPFAALEASIAEQSRRLRRLTGPFAGELPVRGLRRLPARRVAARLSGQVATGQGLDQHILLPGLERRRYRGLRTRG